MSDNQLHLRENEMQEIIDSLATVYTGISEVAGTAYVTDGVFSESTGDSVDAISGIPAVLSACASNMETIISNMVRYLERVIVEFNQADLDLAIKAIAQVNQER